MAWLPLESNPEVMTKFLHSLGVPQKWQAIDVYSLDDEMLTAVPQPVISVLLLFPWSDKYEQFKATQETEISQKGQMISDKVYYLKQVVSNACGTIALIHSVGNNLDKVQLGDGYLKQFLDDSLPLTPDERGSLLEKSDGIISTHKTLAMEGQSQPPDPDNIPNYHFVAFVEKDGQLYELDGRKSFPVNHGDTSAATILQDAAKICKEYMARDPDEVHFTVVAVTAV